MHVLRERLAGFGRDDFLETGDDRLPIRGAELGVEHGIGLDLVVLDQLLEVMVLDAEHDLAVHLQKTAIAVIGEALVAALFGQPRDRLVVEPEIEDGIHHPRHRGARARAHRHQERLLRIAESGADRILDRSERGGDLLLQIGRVGLSAGVKMGADLGGDREAGRHREPEIAHLGETGALAAQKIAHIGAPLRAAGAKAVDPFCPTGRHGGFTPFQRTLIVPFALMRTISPKYGRPRPDRQRSSLLNSLRVLLSLAIRQRGLYFPTMPIFIASWK